MLGGHGNYLVRLFSWLGASPAADERGATAVLNLRGHAFIGLFAPGWLCWVRLAPASRLSGTASAGMYAAGIYGQCETEPRHAAPQVCAGRTRAGVLVVPEPQVCKCFCTIVPRFCQGASALL